MLLEQAWGQGPCGGSCMTCCWNRKHSWVWVRLGGCCFAVCWWCDPAMVCPALLRHPAAQYHSEALFRCDSLPESTACSVTALIWGCRVVPAQVTPVRCCGRDCYLWISPLVSRISEVTDAVGFAPDLGRRSLEIGVDEGFQRCVAGCLQVEAGLDVPARGPCCCVPVLSLVCVLF